MSKSQFTSDDFSQPPPPYSPSQSYQNNSNLQPSSSSSASTPSLFAAQIASLHAQIVSNNQTHLSLRDEQASRYLSAIVPRLEHLLQQIAGIHPVPSVVEAYFVPESAVDKSWDLSDKGEKLRRELRRVVRVSEKGLDGYQGEKGGGKESSLTTETTAAEEKEKGFDEWGWWDDNIKDGGTGAGSSAGGGGSSKLWWDDERMARQIGRSLQSSSRSDGKVSMRIAAEEVTFRRENEMGLWESKSGWGIVARLRIRV